MCVYKYVITLLTCDCTKFMYCLSNCNRWNWAPPPQKKHVLTEPVNVILFGKRVFADIIHLRISK